MTIKKIDNWQTELSSLIENKNNKSFDFSNWNCLLWVCEAIKVLTEKDIAIEFKGKFNSEKSAAKLMRKLYNVKSSQDLLIKFLGETKSIAFAKKGDIVFAKSNNEYLNYNGCNLFGNIPGVCYGNVSFFVGENSLIKIDTFKLDSVICLS